MSSSSSSRRSADHSAAWMVGSGHPAVAIVRVAASWSGSGFDGPTAFLLDGDSLLPLDRDEPRIGTGTLSPAPGTPATPLDTPAPTIDLGGTLLPSLTDHHVHLGLIDPAALFDGGITHAVDLGWIPEIASAWLADTAGRPAVAIAGALITAPGGYPVASGWAPPGAAEEVGGPREAAEAVRKQVMHGASRIKVALNSDAGRTVDDATLAALVEESHAAGLPVVAHVQGDGQTARAVRAGIDQLAHTPFSERIDDSLAAEAVRRGMTWISTLDIHGWGTPTEHFRIALHNLRRFAALGGRVRYGTDLGNGDLPVGVNERELAALQAAGLTGTDLVRTIAGDTPAPAFGPRLAWIPAPPPADGADDADDDADGIPAWLATARALRVADLTNPTPITARRQDHR